MTNKDPKDMTVEEIKEYIKQYWREGLKEKFSSEPSTEEIKERLKTNVQNFLDLAFPQNEMKVDVEKGKEPGEYTIVWLIPYTAYTVTLPEDVLEKSEED